VAAGLWVAAGLGVGEGRTRPGGEGRWLVGDGGELRGWARGRQQAGLVVGEGTGTGVGEGLERLGRERQQAGPR
jgi:hypothetical protein